MELLPKIPVDASLRLNVFCTRDQDAWRLYVAPGSCPRVLRPLLDQHWEAYPLLLDFDDLAGFVGAAPDSGPDETGNAELEALAAKRAAEGRLLPDTPYELQRETMKGYMRFYSLRQWLKYLFTFRFAMLVLQSWGLSIVHAWRKDKSNRAYVKALKRLHLRAPHLAKPRPRSVDSDSRVW